MTITFDPIPPPASTSTFIDFQGSFLVSNDITLSSGTTQLTVEIPAAFLKGLADCDAGRVIDMDKAMEEPPPNSD